MWKPVVSALALSAALLAAAPAAAQDASRFASDGSADILWTQVFASPGDDWVNLLLPLASGEVLAAGFLDRVDGQASPDWRALAARLRLDGTQIWRAEFGAGSGHDAFWGGVETSGGDLMLSGFTSRIGQGETTSGDIDAFVARLSGDGKLIAERALGEAGYDRMTDLASTRDGGFIGVGFTSAAGRGRDLTVIGFGPDGAERWRRNHGGEGDDQALYIEPAGDGGYILSGGVSDGDGDILVMKIDAEGRELWRRVVGEPGGLDVPHNLIVRPDGRIAVSGYTASWGSRGPHDLFSLTLSPAGDVLRLEVLGGAEDDRGMVSGLDAEGRIWLTGYTRSAGAGGWDVFVTRIDADGAFEGHVSTFGGPGDDNGTAVLPLADGTLLLAAYTTSLRSPDAPGGAQDAVVARVSAPRWTAPHPAFTRRRVQ